MADVTISGLSQGIPDKGSAIIPYSDGSTTYKTSPSGIVAASPGCLLNIVQTVKTSTETINSITFTDIPGYSASITPKSVNSKIYIMISANVSHDYRTGGNIQLKRNGVAIPQSIGFWFYAGDSNTNFSGMAATINHLDSPNSISLVNYQVAWRSDNTIGSGIYLNRSPNLAPANQIGTSSITLMEIAG